MSEDTFGIVLAAQRARAWLPDLEDHERSVLMAMVLYTDTDGTASPTAGQLAEMLGRHVQTVRRTLRGMVREGGPLVKVGDRPIWDAAEERFAGGRVGIYSIAPTERLDAQLAIEIPSERLGAQVAQIPSERLERPNRARAAAQVSVQARAIERLKVEQGEPETPGERLDAQVEDSLAARHPRREGETLGDWLSRLSGLTGSGIEIGSPVADNSACAEGVHEFRSSGDWATCRDCDMRVPMALAEISA